VLSFHHSILFSSLVDCSASADESNFSSLFIIITTFPPQKIFSFASSCVSLPEFLIFSSGFLIAFFILFFYQQRPA
jgi:hypothetical protein